MDGHVYEFSWSWIVCLSAYMCDLCRLSGRRVSPPQKRTGFKHHYLHMKKKTEDGWMEGWRLRLCLLFLASACEQSWTNLIVSRCCCCCRFASYRRVGSHLRLRNIKNTFYFALWGLRLDRVSPYAQPTTSSFTLSQTHILFWDMGLHCVAMMGIVHNDPFCVFGIFQFSTFFLSFLWNNFWLKVVGGGALVALLAYLRRLLALV